MKKRIRIFPINPRFNRWRVVSLFAVALLLVLSAGMHSLHNHDADMAEHHDCPVHKLELVLSSAIVLAVFTLIARYRNEKIVTSLHTLICVFIIFKERTRAPPLFSGLYRL